MCIVSTILKLPNPTWTNEDFMVDEKVLRAQPVPFAYELKCPACDHIFHQVTLQRGIFCPVCGRKDPNHKTYRCLVKVSHER